MTGKKRYFLFGLIPLLSMLIFKVCLAGPDYYTTSLEKSLPSLQGEKKADALNDLSDISREYSMDKARNYGQRALAYSRQIDYYKGEAMALTNIGAMLVKIGEFDSALVKFNQAISVLSAHNDLKNKALPFNMAGNMFRIKGDYKNSISYLVKAQSISEFYNIGKERIKSYLNLGTWYIEKGDYVKSYEYSTKALNLATQLNNDRYIAVAYIEIGQCDFYKNDFHKSLSNNFKALALAKKLNLTSRIKDIYNNLSVTYLELNEFDKALDYQNMLLQLFNRDDDTYALGLTYLNLGRIYLRQKDYVNGKIFLDKAMDFSKKTDNDVIYAEARLSLGEFYEGMGNPVLALDNYNRGLDYFSNEGVSDKIIETYKVLSDHYAAHNDPHKALDYFRQLYAIKDSIDLVESRSLSEAISAKAAAEIEINNLIQQNMLQTAENEKSRIIIFSVSGCSIIIIVSLIYAFKKKVYIRKTEEALNYANLQNNKLYFNLVSDIRTTLFALALDIELISGSVSKSAHERISANYDHVSTKINQIINEFRSKRRPD